MQASSHDVAGQLLELWHQLLRDASRLYALLEAHSIGMTDLKLLHHLSGLPSEPTVKELAEHMGLSLPGASRAADSLLRRGWLERREDADDRRMKRLAITDDGRALLRRVEEARLAGLEQLLATVPADDLARLSEAVSPVLEHLKEART